MKLSSRGYGLGVAMFAPAVLYIVALIGLPFALAFMYAFSDVAPCSAQYPTCFRASSGAGARPS